MVSYLVTLIVIVDNFIPCDNHHSKLVRPQADQIHLHIIHIVLSHFPLHSSSCYLTSLPASCNINLLHLLKWQKKKKQIFFVSWPNKNVMLQKTILIYQNTVCVGCYDTDLVQWCQFQYKSLSHNQNVINVKTVYNYHVPEMIKLLFLTSTTFLTHDRFCLYLPLPYKSYHSLTFSWH